MYCILKVCVIYLILVRVCRVYHTHIFKVLLVAGPFYLDLLYRDYLFL
nr:MAG TPA: hypothetical protein [Caudoviricetes sp.]